jgi:cytochrome c biogenesis protein CcdA
LLVPAVLVAALLLLIVGLRGGLEEAVSNLASVLPVGYAFAAGMVASVNPCGALMLPSYIFFQLGVDEEAEVSTVERVLKALRLAIATAAGFAVVFGLVGAVVSVGGRWLTGFFPYAGLIIGLAMVGLGIWLLVSHRSLGILAASRVSVAPERSLSNMFLFGIAYAISSLSCTLPIFLVVVGSALTAGGWMTSLAQFIGYALGMSFVMAAVSVGTSLFRQAVERWLRRLMPHVHRVSALFLIGAGLYLIYYWVFEVGLLG